MEMIRRAKHHYMTVGKRRRNIVISIHLDRGGLGHHKDGRN